MHKAFHPAPIDWIRLVALSIKTYIATAWYISELSSRMTGRHSDLSGYFWYGYLFSIFALALIIWVQKKRGDRIGSLFGFAWMIVAAFLSITCLPSL